jgi:hypothetical protein
MSPLPAFHLWQWNGNMGVCFSAGLCPSRNRMARGGSGAHGLSRPGIGLQNAGKPLSACYRLPLREFRWVKIFRRQRSVGAAFFL